MSTKKQSNVREQIPNEDLLWKQSKEIRRLGRVYGLLDGTICTSREHAIAANQELTREYMAA